MQTTYRTLSANKHIALVAHDHCKADLINWCKTHRTLLNQSGETFVLFKKYSA